MVWQTGLYLTSLVQFGQNGKTPLRLVTTPETEVERGTIIKIWCSELYGYIRTQIYVYKGNFLTSESVVQSMHADLVNEMSQV